jgi:hypothetical protein
VMTFADFSVVIGDTRGGSKIAVSLNYNSG